MKENCTQRPRKNFEDASGRTLWTTWKFTHLNEHLSVTARFIDAALEVRPACALGDDRDSFARRAENIFDLPMSA